MGESERADEGRFGEVLFSILMIAKGFEWLLKLDDKSFEYKSNSPKDTIEKVLCTWCNFSVYKSVEEKVFAAKKALEIDRILHTHMRIS